MTYFFSDTAGLDGFITLSAALGGAGRKLPLLPPVERCLRGARPNCRTADQSRRGCAAVVAGPRRVSDAGNARGAAGGAAGGRGCRGSLVDGPLDVSRMLASARAGQQLTYCFLDDDPVATAGRLRPVLEKRWNATDVDPLFAAPFHPVVPHDWGRYCRDRRRSCG